MAAHSGGKHSGRQDLTVLPLGPSVHGGFRAGRLSERVGCNSLLVLPQPIKGKDYRKQGPAGTADKPYTMPKVKQDGPPPGGFGPIKTKRFVGVTTSIPSSV